jgi:Nucleotidyltransferase domain
MIGSTPGSDRLAVRRDAAALVRKSFGGCEVFSCLSGSTVTGDAASRSDIDIVVVIPDDLPLSMVLLGRAAFTRGYLALHHRHGRTPDRQWPGEVLYAQDVRDAYLGAAFDLDDVSGPLIPGPLDTSHRYWTSMIACSVPLTRAAEWSAAARQCRRLIAAHVLHSRSHALMSHRHGAASALREGSSWGGFDMHLRREWGIRPGPGAARAVLDTEIRRLNCAMDWEGGAILGRLRTRLRGSHVAPRLDRFQDRWRDLALGRTPAAGRHE